MARTMYDKALDAFAKNWNRMAVSAQAPGTPARLTAADSLASRIQAAGPPSPMNAMPLTPGLLDTPATFAARCLARANEVIVDFRATPFHLVDTELGGIGLTGGHHRGMAAAFKSQLADGRSNFVSGPTAVVDLEKAFEMHRELLASAGVSEIAAHEAALLRCAGLVIHEQSHALCAGDKGDGPALHPNADIARKAFTTFGEDPDDIKAVAGNAAGNDGIMAPWAGHGPVFLRAAAHLGHRLEYHIPGLRFEHILRHEEYRLRPLAEYRIMLGKELDSQAPIVQLLATAPPADFVCLWQLNARSWFREIEQRRSPTRCDTRILTEALSWPDVSPAKQRPARPARRKK